MNTDFSFIQNMSVNGYSRNLLTIKRTNIKGIGIKKETYIQKMIFHPVVLCTGTEKKYLEV